MIRIAFASLGCKTNQYETDALAEWFRRRGFSVVDDRETADVYVLNTCTVTAEAERKARQLFRRYRKHNRNALIVANGCYAQRADLSDMADLTVGTVGRSQIPALVLDALTRRGVIEPSCRDTGLLLRGHLDDRSSKAVSSAPNVANNAERGLPEDRFSTGLREDISDSVEDQGVPQESVLYEELPAPAIPGETRAFLKVQDGCDYRCAYCAISIARGPSRSRALPQILEETRGLAAHGFSEFVLTGTNLNLYGADFRRRSVTGQSDDRSLSLLSELTSAPATANDLADVIVALDRLEGVRRLRLGSLESRLITEEFIKKIVEVKSLCPSFHLSLQSGSDRILKAMNRRDTRASYRDAVARIRAAFPDAGITTDLIVGFPGETEDDFEETLSFCDEIGFLRIHVFRFSSRPGTLAHKMPDRVPNAIAAERSEILRAKAAQLAQDAIRERLGKTREVLVEKLDACGRAEGYTPEYIFVKGAIRQEGCLAGSHRIEMPVQGSIVPMRIVGVEDQTAIAEII